MSPWSTGSALAAGLIECAVLAREAVADLEEVLFGYETAVFLPSPSRTS